MRKTNEELQEEYDKVVAEEAASKTQEDLDKFLAQERAK